MLPLQLAARPDVLTLRCPYCHGDLPGEGEGARCEGCGARVHGPCAHELGRCATCGGVRFSWLDEEAPPGWWTASEVLGARGQGAIAFVRALPRELPSRDLGRDVALSLSLDRREVPRDGVLAGEAVLTVPRPSVLSGLEAHVVAESFRPWVLGLTRRDEVEKRSVRLLGGPGPGVWAEGTYRVGFRIPLAGLPATEDRPGAEVHARVRLLLRLERKAARALAAEVEVRVGVSA